MEIAVALLLISTLATTGLAALAAATMRGHWFLRTAAFFALIAPLLLVPAYEPFLALTLEGAVIAAGVALARWRKQRRAIPERAGSSPTPARPAAIAPVAATAPTPAATEAPTPARPPGAKPQASGGPRFSLGTLLLAMVLCGAAAAIAPRVPTLNREGWQSIALVGACGGAAVLLSAWAATRRGWRKIPASGVACFLGAALGIVLIKFDWFLPGLYEGGAWPPLPSSALLTPDDDVATADWLVSMQTLVAIAALVTWLFRLATSGAASVWVRRVAGVAVAATVALVSAFAAVVLYAMLTPEPIPQVTLPVPNAYDAFVAAGQTLEHALVNSGSFDQNTAPRQQVEQAAAEAAAAVARGRQAFAEEGLVPVEYRSDANLLKVLTMRWLSRGFSVTGRLAEMDSDWDAALTAQLDIVRLGVMSCRGGLIIDGIVGRGVASGGETGVFEIIDRLSARQCRTAIGQLQQLDALREPYQAFAHRDRAWSQHVYGWITRLYHAVEDIDDFEQRTLGEAWFPEGYEGPFQLETVRSRMLVAHLALRAYQAEHGALPVTWEEVEAAGLPALGVDPWDPDGGPLRYFRDGDRPVIYSVGQNRIDEEGAEPSEYADPSMAGMGDPATGDLLIEEVFD